MKKMLRLAALIGVMGSLSWLSSGPGAEAGPRDPTCESLDSTACSPLGQTTSCWSLWQGQTRTCYCFNSGTHTIWSCPIPP